MRVAFELRTCASQERVKTKELERDNRYCQVEQCLLQIASHVSFQQYLAGLSGWNLTVPVGHHFAGTVLECNRLILSLPLHTG